MNKTTYTTTRYSLYEDGFYVEVSKPYDCVELYLCHKSYDYKMFVGRLSSSSTQGDLEEYISREVYEYIPCYWSEIKAFEFDETLVSGLEWEEFDKSMDYVMEHGYVEN